LGHKIGRDDERIGIYLGGDETLGGTGIHVGTAAYAFAGKFNSVFIVVDYDL